MSRVDQKWRSLRVWAVALLAVGSAFLGSGAMLALRDDAPAEVSVVSPRLSGNLVLDGPLTIYADDRPVVTVHPNGTVEVLEDWNPGTTLLAATDCPAGGVALAVGGETVSVCNGSDGLPGTPGLRGPASTLLARSVPLEDHAACPGAAILLLLGADDGGGLANADDGILDADEVDAETVLCHGVSITGDQGATGLTGLHGPPGTGLPGRNGTDGLDGRVATETIAAGPQCPTGGIRLTFWSDDGDGVQEPHEPPTFATLCNGRTGNPGANGTPGGPGPSGIISVASDPDDVCSDNGVRIDAGIDDGAGGATAGDGLLMGDERRSTQYVCDGKADHGHASLISLSDPPEGACRGGGTVVSTGLDDGNPGGTADDLLLDPLEVDATRTLCDGDPGHATLFRTAPANATACPQGGIILTSGLDDGEPDGTADDGDLHPLEVDTTDPLCGGAGQPGFNALLETQIINVGSALCPKGGTLFKGGTDDGSGGGVAGNAMLDGSEATVQNQLCHGKDGIAWPDACREGMVVVGINATGHITCRHHVPAFSTVPRAMVEQTLATTTAGASMWPSLTVGSDGRPFVAYHDPAAAALKAAHCLDPRCTSWDTIVLDDPASGWAGRHAQAIVGPTGHPAIAYAIDDGTARVRLMQCLDAACATAWRVDVPNIVPAPLDLWFAGEASRDPTPSYLLRGTNAGGLSENIWCSPSDTCATFGSITYTASGAATQGIYTDYTGDGNIIYASGGNLVGRAFANTNTLSVQTGSNLIAPTVATGPDGRIHILYGTPAGSGHDWYMFRCNNDSCTTHTAPVRVSSASQNGHAMGRPAMTVSDHGLPFWVANDAAVGPTASPTGLFLNQCRDPECTITTHFLLAPGGSEADISFGHDGVPVVAWVDPGGELKFRWTGSSTMLPNAMRR